MKITDKYPILKYIDLVPRSLYGLSEMTWRQRLAYSIFLKVGSDEWKSTYKIERDIMNLFHSSEAGYSGHQYYPTGLELFDVTGFRYTGIGLCLSNLYRKDYPIAMRKRYHNEFSFLTPEEIVAWKNER